MIYLAIFEKQQKYVSIASLQYSDRSIETGIVESISNDSFQAASESLDSLRMIGDTQLTVIVNDSPLKDFLTPPIKVEPTEKTEVRLGREKFNVPSGGNPHQWNILNRLFLFRWNIKHAEITQNAIKVMQRLERVT